MNDLLKKYPTPGVFLKKVFGIDNVMDFDFPSVEKAKEENFIFDRVKGNHRLIEKSVMTREKANSLILKAKDFNLKIVFAKIFFVGKFLTYCI